MRLDQINVFLEIVRIRNLTKAAENLHMSQSSVSQQLKLLEQELGVQLIMRHKGQRTAELTCHGEEFIPLAESWMHLLQQTESLKESAPRELVLGAVDSLNASILSCVCQQLLQAEASMNLRICTDQSDQLYKLADSRQIDLGFVSYVAKIPHVTVKPVFSQKMCVVHCRRPEDPQKLASPTGLMAKDEIQLNWGQDYLQWRKNWWNPNIHPHVVTDSMILLRHFLQTPGCWAVVPAMDFLTTPDPSLEICNFGPNNPPDRMVYLIEPDHIRPNRKDCIARFMETLENFVSAAPELVWRYPQE